MDEKKARRAQEICNFSNFCSFMNIAGTYVQDDITDLLYIMYRAYQFNDNTLYIAAAQKVNMINRAAKGFGLGFLAPIDSNMSGAKRLVDAMAWAISYYGYIRSGKWEEIAA